MDQHIEAGNDRRLVAANLPTNMLCSLVLLAEEQGIDCQPWFAGLRLSPGETCDPQVRVSYRQAATVIRRALRSLPAPAPGLAIGARQNGSNFGLLGLAMRMARDFGEAVRIGLDFQQNQGPLLDLRLDDVDGQHVAVTATPPLKVPEILPFLCEEMFSSLLMLARELTDSRFAPTRVELAYPAPAHAGQYRELFGCPVLFDQSHNRLVLERRWLSLPFPHHNPVSSRQALAMCQAQMATTQGNAGETIAAVERQLRPRLRENPKMDDIATRLHLSGRTLRRRLAEEGQCYSDIHDRVRTERALELLENHKLGIAQVGSQLGFNDAREFRRAFKRWTGHTPSQARTLAN
ncbi:AraC family transcriptional regulator [Pseudoxanthomonas kalamensis DSM 18571]|uniref:AraC family transcriptional regulator n=1 Tax=Pseudoxanthomonas kalamensis TaxID=289483 RepID=UPI001391A409|nr:AraC family transcriptional regulator [Pseudoxanthomonas kalamensis]KAF1711404.1 AraC family transcriptional regulator [Pseudoxanthomonas kalamensis DSM 18571]